MNVTLSNAQAKAIVAILFSYLAKGGRHPGVSEDDVAEVLRIVSLAMLDEPAA